MAEYAAVFFQRVVKNEYSEDDAVNAREAGKAFVGAHSAAAWHSRDGWVTGHASAALSCTAGARLGSHTVVQPAYRLQGKDRLCG